jgi:hypothetical protein
MLPFTARTPRVDGGVKTRRKGPESRAVVTVRWVNLRDREAILAFVRALARDNARLDLKADGWRKRPRKRVLKPKVDD